MDRRYIILSVVCIITNCLCEIKRIRYISTEHPVVEYYDRTHVRFLNLTSQRYNRENPFYYVGMHFSAIYEFHNNVTANFFFYEFLSNRYRRGFVEMHWKVCDLIHNDKFFGTALKQGKLKQPCPFPAGEYHLYNMTIPITQIPKNFPFTKGRIYCNMTTTYKNEVIVSGYIDMEIKVKTIRRQTI